MCRSKMKNALRIQVTGVVQGVGFRPFVYELATRYDLAGYILNNSQGVEIEIEGQSSSLDSFLHTLRDSPPPLAIIKKIHVDEIEPGNYVTFQIRESEKQETQTVLIPPDFATCSDCLQELFNPLDRRYRYPFINCTNCGPRYTIIQDLPYDRSRTTMSAFEMCQECRAEYEDPLNRRFHAEPTCCPNCGPHVWLTDQRGSILEYEDPIAACVQFLEKGAIVAIKGLGGFHLACDASYDEAVCTLRNRKMREAKPFALMVKDMDAARQFIEIEREGEMQDGGFRLAQSTLLSSRERPILLLKKKRNSTLSHFVAPNSAHLGIMLPYTPLHHLIMQGSYPALVMTSANLTDEPIAYQNEDALERLSTIADYYLLHNRPIHIRTDDSVMQFISGKPHFLRRSRGYAPFPLELPIQNNRQEILSLGPEMNNTISLTQGDHVFMSHYLGDLQNAFAYQSFLQAIDHLSNVLEIKPTIIACDTHPDYLSSRYAHESGLQVIEVQHHHAHIASVLAEHGRTDRVIGVSFDGLGWGENNELWGGEFLVCDLSDYQRAGHLQLIPQPGGDVCTKRITRMAYMFLQKAFGKEADRIINDLFPAFSEQERKIVTQMVEKGINTPYTSSAGRLFDTASAILNICTENTYEGQAPMELEGTASQAESEEGFYPVPIEENDSTLIVKTPDLIRQMTQDYRSGVNREICAVRFHNSIAQFVLEMCIRIRDRTKLNTVALSGGVFANAILTEKLTLILEKEGFEVLTNIAVPAGDGGICLGQAAVAAWRLSGLRRTAP